MNAPPLSAAFEKDVTDLLSDKEIAKNIVLDISYQAMEISNKHYGLPADELFIEMFQIVIKNLNNELD